MAYYNETSARSVGVSNRVNAWLHRLGAKIRARRVYNETFNGLSALSERELDDLGLNRSELRRVAWEAAHKVN